MTKYAITGIWKGDDEVITHYAFHEFYDNGLISRARKISKAEAVRLVENASNQIVIWTWNYKDVGWDEVEKVHVVDSFQGKYLRSNRDNKLTDNLNHLINYDWL